MEWSFTYWGVKAEFVLTMKSQQLKNIALVPIPGAHGGPEDPRLTELTATAASTVCIAVIRIARIHLMFVLASLSGQLLKQSLAPRF